jgi:alpha-beta hydrolase superfamily lysophospholipase
MSEGPREYVDHFKDILEDAYKFATIVKKDYPSVPHIVVGYDAFSVIFSLCR